MELPSPIHNVFSTNLLLASVVVAVAVAQVVVSWAQQLDDLANLWLKQRFDSQSLTPELPARKQKRLALDFGQSAVEVMKTLEGDM